MQDGRYILDRLFNFLLTVPIDKRDLILAKIADREDIGSVNVWAIVLNAIDAPLSPQALRRFDLAEAETIAEFLGMPSQEVEHVYLLWKFADNPRKREFQRKVRAHIKYKQPKNRSWGRASLPIKGRRRRASSRSTLRKDHRNRTTSTRG